MAISIAVGAPELTLGSGNSKSVWMPVAVSSAVQGLYSAAVDMAPTTAPPKIRALITPKKTDAATLLQISLLSLSLKPSHESISEMIAHIKANV